TGDLLAIERISERERSPLYVAGHATGNNQFRFIGLHGKNPIDWKVRHMLGSSPKTVLTDQSDRPALRPLHYEEGNFSMYLHDVLQLEAVACKDWLTNKVDRSVTGKVATQQTCGEIQLPLNNLGVMALDFNGIKGVATSIGHAPGAGLIDPAAASQLAIAEALTNLIWAPLTFGLEGVSLSANWMWPAKVEGENARLYEAVEAASNFAISLGINIPTGKDSLSMTQKYPNGEKVHSPGTVIISTVGEVEDIRKTVTPVLKSKEGSFLYYIDFSGDTKKLGGSSFAQVLNALGDQAPTIKNPVKFIDAFNTVQSLIKQGKIMAGHDIGSGGLITSLLEMCFTSLNIGMELNIPLTDEGLTAFLFAENPGIVIQAEEEVEEIFKKHGISTVKIGIPVQKNTISLQYGEISHTLHIEELRDRWFKTSYLLDIEQRGDEHATLRFENYKKQPLRYVFPKNFKGHVEKNKPSKVTAAIIREKGVNGDREMAWSLYKAGFKVKDIHMTDLVSGREDLTDVHMIVFVGGFSNSDVLGSAKGWAGAFLYNQKAKQALDNFYQREDTLSLGVCNGCQLMMELDLLYPDMKNHPKMLHNGSHKFESSFVTINIEEVNSIMLQPLKGTRLGAWVAHGEGRFSLSETPSHYNIAARFSYDQYPGNPNGSDLNTAALCSKDGRHLAIMPHIERSLYPWNWPHYPEERIHSDEISPWIMAFESALEWVQERVENAK
ncbi:MAG: phosphoribosylformylglycinamidine synthase, partial [Cyclobacteriaceae bacterium]|nr:phosphoribosylformylglycinamidine synthase [Cyclobacteriaceae bacterium]